MPSTLEYPQRSDAPHRLHGIRLAVPEQELEQLPMAFFRAIGKLPIRFSAAA